MGGLTATGRRFSRRVRRVCPSDGRASGRRRWPSGRRARRRGVATTASRPMRRTVAAERLAGGGAAPPQPDDGVDGWPAGRPRRPDRRPRRAGAGRGRRRGTPGSRRRSRRRRAPSSRRGRCRRSGAGRTSSGSRRRRHAAVAFAAATALGEGPTRRGESVMPRAHTAEPVQARISALGPRRAGPGRGRRARRGCRDVRDRHVAQHDVLVPGEHEEPVGVPVGEVGEQLELGAVRVAERQRRRHRAPVRAPAGAARPRTTHPVAAATGSRRGRRRRAPRPAGSRVGPVERCLER